MGTAGAARPSCEPGGRPPKHSRREILNGIFYAVRSGGAWKLLPHDLPPWRTVYHYFWSWRRTGIWQRIHNALREQVREAAGRNTNPSAAILDSQSIRTSEAGGVRGYDGGKQICGRKRHILVDVLGLLLLVVVTAANVQDRNGAQLLLLPLAQQFRRLRLIWADGAYAGRLEPWVRGLRKWGKVRLEIVRKPKGQKGFMVLPWRWRVERTFAWLCRHRRLIPSCIQTCSNRKVNGMRPPQPLPETALKELSALLKQCKDKATYQRVQCVWLRAALGLSAPPVAQALGWSLSAVHHVQARYLRHGTNVLLGPGRGGRAHAHLSIGQEQQLLADFAVSATQGGVVEAGPVRTAYESAVGCSVPKSTVYRLLSRHGWRKLAPRPQHVAASRVAQEAFQKSFVAWYAPRGNANSNKAAQCG